MGKSSLPSPLEAASEIASFLDEHRVPYVIIGGLAVQYWGEPRATRDVDVSVLVPPPKEEEFFSAILSRFRARIQNAQAFARQSRVLLLFASNECPIDVSLGIPGYEAAVMKRAVRVKWGASSPLRLIGCEDLIIHKCVAGRPRDLEDVKSILVRQKRNLKLRHIRRWLREFQPLLTHNCLEAFESLLRAYP